MELKTSMRRSPSMQTMQTFLNSGFVRWEKQAFVPWQLPGAHHTPPFGRAPSQGSQRTSVSPITKLSETGQPPRTQFSRCLFWKVNHIFCREASFFQNSHLFSVMAGTFHSHVPLPFPVTPHSWTEATFPDGEEWPQGRPSALHPQCWRGMQRNNFVLSQTSSSLWFFSCFAGLPALTGVATDNALENFFYYSVLFFFKKKISPFKISLPFTSLSITSYCQSLPSLLGVWCIHFSVLIIAFEDWKGT